MAHNTVAIIQARLGSSRLPGKIFLDLEGVAVLGRVLERVKAAQSVDRVIVACPEGSSDDPIEKYIRKYYPEIGIFRGSENDVLARYHGAATENDADTIVRITSDCPLMDPYVIDRVVGAYYKQRVDYCANILGKRMYPRGLDVEVFSYELLDRMHRQASEPEDREHVTLMIRKSPDHFRIYSVEGERDYSQYRLTLDEHDDYLLISKIYQELGGQNVSLGSVINLLQRQVELVQLNDSVKQKYAQY